MRVRERLTANENRKGKRKTRVDSEAKEMVIVQKTRPESATNAPGLNNGFHPHSHMTNRSSEAYVIGSKDQVPLCV